MSINNNLPSFKTKSQKNVKGVETDVLEVKTLLKCPLIAGFVHHNGLILVSAPA